MTEYSKEYNIKCLDKYDFSKFLSQGRDLWSLRDAIEKKYDNEFRVMYKIYPFEYLSSDDIMDYFTSRYTVIFEPYTSYWCKHSNSPYATKKDEEEWF